jgi:hypothetical protein
VFHIVGDGVVDGAPLQALVQLAGTEGHVFPGAELARLDVENDVVTVELDPRCVARSALLLFVADDRPALVVNGVPHTVTTGAGARSGARWVRVELGSLPAPPARLPSAASSLDATSARARRSPEAMPPGPTEL